MVDLKLKDNEFKYVKTTHKRDVARAVILNDKNEMCLLNVIRNDEFGNASYYETPGGGVDSGEDFIKAVIREVDEEVGLKVEVIAYLGCVDDYYNLIYRNNINHYYLCKIVGKTKIHHVSLGDDLIHDIIFVNINEAINLYEKSATTKIGKLLLNREKPILIEANKILNEKNML